MDRNLKIINGHVYVSGWPNPDIVVLENTAYTAFVRFNNNNSNLNNIL